MINIRKLLEIANTYHKKIGTRVENNKNDLSKEIFKDIYVVIAAVTKVKHKNVNNVNANLDYLCDIIENELNERTGRFYRKDYGNIINLYLDAKIDKRISKKMLLNTYEISGRLLNYLEVTIIEQERIMAEEKEKEVKNVQQWKNRMH